MKINVHIKLLKFIVVNVVIKIAFFYKAHY